MTKDDDLQVRTGRSRGRSDANGVAALRQVRIAVARAGGAPRRTGDGSGATMRPSTFGRGRSALAGRVHALGTRRQVVVKARVVRRSAGGLAAHIGYLQRDGVTREGEAGSLFDAKGDGADGGSFASRAKDDRHHFRFIVAPRDAGELADLRAYTRDLMTAVQKDLAAPLDWVAVDHWNTPHPHVHILVRGRLDDGADLVISRDYISRGVRGRAEALVELELGPPGAREQALAIARDIETRGWTRLDRILERLANPGHQIDLKPRAGSRGRADLEPLARRLKRLARLGLAEPAGPGRWRLAPDFGTRLRALERDAEIAGRLAAAVDRQGLARAPEQWTTSAPSEVVVGRVLERGGDDELRGTGFAVVDGLDGRVHHITLADAGAADPRVGAVIRVAPASRGAHPLTTTLSDLPLPEQARAAGATWLDRRLVDPRPLANHGGFCDEVAAALEARVDHLVAQGLAQKREGRVRFSPGLLDRLRAQEVGAAGDRIRRATGLVFRPTARGEVVSGVYRRRVDLASGRFAMIDDGKGFSLVPWRPALEKDRGRTVSGRVGDRGEIAWRPPRGLGR